MKTKLMMAVAGVLVSQASLADGFRCEAVDRSIRATVYNHTSPSQGTRSSAILVLSDPSISHGNKTIAVFKKVKGNLSQNGARYMADVDLRYSELKKGEYLFGTRLGQLDTIALKVDFNYSRPMKKGELVEGLLIAKKRNGAAMSIDMECERYLKN